MFIVQCWETAAKKIEAVPRRGSHISVSWGALQTKAASAWDEKGKDVAFIEQGRYPLYISSLQCFVVSLYRHALVSAGILFRTPPWIPENVDTLETPF